jgi:hypothetical protein
MLFAIDIKPAQPFSQPDLREKPRSAGDLERWASQSIFYLTLAQGEKP